MALSSPKGNSSPLFIGGVGSLGYRLTLALQRGSLCFASTLKQREKSPICQLLLLLLPLLLLLLLEVSSCSLLLLWWSY